MIEFADQAHQQNLNQFVKLTCVAFVSWSKTQLINQRTMCGAVATLNVEFLGTAVTRMMKFVVSKIVSKCDSIHCHLQLQMNDLTIRTFFIIHIELISFCCCMHDFQMHDETLNQYTLIGLSIEDYEADYDIDYSDSMAP